MPRQGVEYPPFFMLFRSTARSQVNGTRQIDGHGLRSSSATAIRKNTTASAIRMRSRLFAGAFLPTAVMAGCFLLL